MSLTKDQEIILRGYTPNPKIYKPSSKLISLLKELNNLSIAKHDYQVHQMTLDDSIYDTKAFFSRYYKLHKIPYIKYQNNHNYRLKNISPYNLPLFENECQDIFSSSIIEDLISKPYPQIFYHGINLSPIISEQTSASYVHEITHSQLDHQIGAIKEFYHAEILSIFNELFHASILSCDEKILRLNDSRRLYEMATLTENLQLIKNINREDLLLDSQYLISGLKAYNLFISFYYGTHTLKKEIISDIQSIFDGYLTIEELLNKYDITLENSIDKPKLLKYFNR